MSKGLIYILLLPLLLFSCSKFTRLQRTGTIDERYKAAVAYYEDEDYYRAGLLFQDLLPQVNGTARAEECNYYYAYCHYQQRQVILAAFYFKRLYSTYPRSEHAEECMFMRAKCLYESTPKYNLDQTNTQEAIHALQTFLNKYPESTYAEDANKIHDLCWAKLEKKYYEIAKLYQKTGKYKSAVIAYQNFFSDFPDSDFNEELAFRKIEAQFQLAKVSLEQVEEDDKIIPLKKQRYEEVRYFYEDFIDKYPNSSYLNDAENYYIIAAEKIKELSRN